MGHINPFSVLVPPVGSDNWPTLFLYVDGVTISETRIKLFLDEVERVNISTGKLNEIIPEAAGSNRQNAMLWSPTVSLVRRLIHAAVLFVLYIPGNRTYTKVGHRSPQRLLTIARQIECVYDSLVCPHDNVTEVHIRCSRGMFILTFCTASRPSLDQDRIPGWLVLMYGHIPVIRPSIHQQNPVVRRSWGSK